jgi:hypothetical protein
MKKVFSIVIIIGALSFSALTCEMPTDPDEYDPDNPLCQECCGMGCEACNCTGNALGGFYTNEGFVKGECDAR